MKLCEITEVPQNDAMTQGASRAWLAISRLSRVCFLLTFNFPQLLTISHKFLQFPSTFFNYLQLPSTFFNFLQIPSISINILQLSQFTSTSFNFDRLPSSSFNILQFPPTYSDLTFPSYPSTSFIFL